MTLTVGNLQTVTDNAIIWLTSIFHSKCGLFVCFVVPFLFYFGQCDAVNATRLIALNYENYLVQYLTILLFVFPFSVYLCPGTSHYISRHFNTGLFLKI